MFDTTLNHTILKYATEVSSNTFIKNFAGMKGSALTMNFINEVQVTRNTFFENGPVTSFEEALYSPYYKYLALSNRTISLNLMSCDSATNEYEYMQSCYDELRALDMPALTGAVHIEGCETSVICYLPVTRDYIVGLIQEQGYDAARVSAEITAFTAEHSASRMHIRNVIQDNVFENNQA